MESTLRTKRVMRLLIGQEIGRESRKIIRPCIRVALAPRSVELQDDNCAAPSFRSGTGCDVIDSTVNGCATRQRSWGVPQMKGKSERLSIQALRQDNAFRLTVRKMSADERLRTHALGRDLGRTALDRDDPWALFFGREEDGRNHNHLLLSRRWSGNDIIILGMGCRNTLLSMARPIALKVLGSAIPRGLAAAAPHGGGPAAYRARVVNKRNRVHFEQPSWKIKRYP